MKRQRIYKKYFQAMLLNNSDRNKGIKPSLKAKLHVHVSIHVPVSCWYSYTQWTVKKFV